jgi:hypothetical protein
MPNVKLKSGVLTPLYNAVCSLAVQKMEVKRTGDEGLYTYI